MSAIIAKGYKNPREFRLPLSGNSFLHPPGFEVKFMANRKVMELDDKKYSQPHKRSRRKFPEYRFGFENRGGAISAEHRTMNNLQTYFNINGSISIHGTAWPGPRKRERRSSRTCTGSTWTSGNTGGVIPLSLRLHSGGPRPSAPKSPSRNSVGSWRGARKVPWHADMQLSQEMESSFQVLKVSIKCGQVFRHENS